MKRSAPLFSRVSGSEAMNGHDSYSSERLSLGGENSNQNISDTSIPSVSSTGSARLRTTYFPQTPTSRATSLVRSSSIPSLKFQNDGGNKLSMAKSHSSGDRTPVTHFCTPRRSAGDRHSAKHTLVSGKQLTDHQQVKTPLKRFFSEANLNKPPETPDCFSKVQMETPRTKLDPESLPVALGEETSNLTVGVRVRPLNAREKSDPAVTNIISVDGNEVKVTCDTGVTHTFSYDHCFWSCDPHHPQFASQNVVFTTMVQPLIDKAFEGYNACLFAYGQTGSGKSYSMMGLDVDSRNSIGREVGIIPRFCHELFERIESLEDSNVGCTKTISESAYVEISYFEIYNEKIHDLLGGSSDGGKRPPLKVREHPQFGPYVVDLSVHGVTSYEDLQGWLTVGNSQRATAATGMNEKSSRSHSIFSIILTQTQEETVNDDCHKHSRRSKINLVDLAGSERLSHTCASGDRLREGVSINRSLLTLGKVIAALADTGNSKKKGFVPYRESVLTWLLRESLGGNSRTTMLATVSPANIHLDETLATLRYACQARTIVNRVRVNENPHDRMIRELRAEVERLRALREDYERQQKLGVSRVLQHQDKSESLEQELESLKEQLRQSENHLRKAQKSWSERLEEAEKCKSEELNHLRRCGVALQLDWKQQQPCLVNLTADPSLSGTLLYLLPPGSICIGQFGGTLNGKPPDIALSGPLVKPHHCTIQNSDGKLTLIPGCGGETFVNGEMVNQRISLQHGDRLVIGGNHYFRVSNPFDCSSSSSVERVADYEFAHQEILRVQEEKLQAELNKAKRKAVEDLEEAKKEAERQLGFQRLNYEQQLEHLEATLEQHKRALSEAQRMKEELEIRKNVLEEEFQKRLDRKDALEEVKFLPVLTYSSNFLQEVEEALNETVALDTSQLSSNSDSVTLHELTVGVEEANQLCKQFGINLEFYQEHILGQSEMECTVRIRDVNKNLVSFWKPAKFIQWLQELRDYDPNDSLKDLLDVNETWEEEEDWKEQDSSRISINTEHMKRKLNESLQQFTAETSSCNDSALESSHNSIMSDNANTEDCLKDTEEINNCLDTIEAEADRLKACSVSKNKNLQAAVLSLQNAVLQIRSALGASSPPTKYFPGPSTDAKPGKSNLRSPGPTPRTYKAVRFFLSNSQLENASESPQ